MQIKYQGSPPECIVNPSVVLVLLGYSKGARKVSGKRIKGTPAVLRRCIQGSQSLTVIIFHGLPPVDKRNFWLTCLDRPRYNTASEPAVSR